MADVQLLVGGTLYEGWQSMRLSQSLEQAAGAFSLSFSERWSGQGQPVPIDEGMACTVKVRGQLALTGYVDDSNINYDATGHGMSVSGRSKAGDLVDCSAEHASGQWKSQTLLAIARELCEPFGISVSSDVDLSAVLEVFTLQHGEPVFDALERGARMAGALLVSGPDGTLAFTRAGKATTSTVLQTGRNILRGERRGSWKERFSSYTVKAQSKGTDTWFGDEAAGPKATADDSAITRRRPLIILSEEQGAGDILQKRATWERNVRAGRSRRVSYTVAGWEHAGGLWAPNLRVHVKDDLLRIDEELLVVSAVLILDGEGTRTELELTRAEAFDVLTLPPEKSHGLFSTLAESLP